VNGISLVGVSQKLAAQTLSNCAICPETGTVHFVLARPPTDLGKTDASNNGESSVVGRSDDTDEREPTAPTVKVNEPSEEGSTSDDKCSSQDPDSFLKAHTEPEFVGRDAVRLIKKKQNEERTGDNSEVWRKVEMLRGMLRLSKMTVLVTSFLLVSAMVTVADNPKRKMM
jgi:hypothetical protein